MSNISVKLLYFGQLRERLGKSQAKMDLFQAVKVGDLFCQILGDDPHLKSWQGSVLYAINQEQVSGDTVVHDGDEVAFMPAMAGG